MKAAGFYGFADARANKASFRLNQRLLQDAFTVLAVGGDRPQLLFADGNVEPQESPTLQAELDSGRWHDLATV